MTRCRHHVAWGGRVSFVAHTAEGRNRAARRNRAWRVDAGKEVKCALGEVEGRVGAWRDRQDVRVVWVGTALSEKRVGKD